MYHSEVLCVRRKADGRLGPPVWQNNRERTTERTTAKTVSGTCVSIHWTRSSCLIAQLMRRLCPAPSFVCVACADSSASAGWPAPRLPNLARPVRVAVWPAHTCVCGARSGIPAESLPGPNKARRMNGRWMMADEDDG